jgi:AraC-like DNA-binding protein
MQTVGAFPTLQLLAALERFGLDRAQLCSAAGVDLEKLDDPMHRLPARGFRSLLIEAEHTSGDPLVALRAGLDTPGRGLVAVLAASQRTLGDAFATLARFGPAASDEVHGEVVRGPTYSLLSFEPDAEEPHGREAAREYLAGFLLRFLSDVSRGAFAASEIRFPHAAQTHAASYGELLGVPVRFRQPACAIVVSNAEFERPIGTPNPELASLLEERLRRQLEVEAGFTWRVRVERVLRLVIEEGGQDYEDRLARRLGVSLRTLQRRLEEEGTSFRETREAVLHERALELLSRPALRLAEIAERLGFADASAFSKAFRRWTGRSPSDVRRGAAPGGPA